MDSAVANGTAVGPQDASTRTTASRMRSIFGGSVGNLVEYFDWYAYSAFALYFAPIFFPQGDLTAQLLSTAGVFAIGFLVRPLGGYLFGAYADRHGRKAALTCSVLLMCVGSLLIAVTPGYATIGAAAPALLVFARVLQGLSLGGEYGTSATYLCEMASKEHRGFWSSFQYVTVILGQLLALGVLIALQQVLLTPEQLASWGWRVPFAIGAACALVALWLRRGIEETSAFQRGAGDPTRRRGLAALLAHPREVLIVLGLTMGGTVAFYTYTTYMQKFLVNSVGLGKDLATLVSAASLFFYMLLQPVVGAISDRVGRRPVLIAFGIGGTLGTYPLLVAIEQADSAWAALGLIMLALTVLSGYTAINAVVKAELFPVEVRALGVGLPFAVAVSLFGGTAEYVALWCKQIGHERWFYGYVTACIAVSLLVYVGMRDTQKHSRIEAESA